MGNNQSTTSLDEIYLAYGESAYGEPEPLRPAPRRSLPRLSRLSSLRRPMSVASDITAPLTPSDERYPYPILEQTPPKVTQSTSRQKRLPSLPNLLLPAPPPPSPTILLPAPPILLPPPPPRQPILLPAPAPRAPILQPTPPKVQQPPSPVSSLTDTLCEVTEPLILGPVPAAPPTPPMPELKPAAFMELTSIPSAPWYSQEEKPAPSRIPTPPSRPTSPPILKTSTNRTFSLSNTSKKVSFTDVKVEEVAAVSPFEEEEEEEVKIDESATAKVTMTEEELEQMGMKAQVDKQKDEQKVEQPATVVAVATQAVIEETTKATPSTEQSYFEVEPMTKTPATELFQEEEETLSTITPPVDVPPAPVPPAQVPPAQVPPAQVPPAQVPLPTSRPGSIQQEKILPSIQEVDEPIMHLPTSPPIMPRSTTPLSQISFSEFKLPPLTRSATFAPHAASRVSFEAPVLLRSHTSAPSAASMHEFRTAQQQLQPRSYTMRQVSRHSTINDLWIVIGDEVFDCTEFAANHPGGAKILNGVAGKDATKKFDKHHPRAVLDRYRATLQIGVVDNTISDGASIMSRSSRTSFSRGKSFLGKFKFGKKKTDEAVIVDDVDDIAGRERRGSM